MKKTIALLISVLMLFSLASCSVLDSLKEAENKPEDVVSAYLDALKTFDADAMDACYYEVESSDATLSDSDIDLLKAMYGAVSYEILGTEIDGLNATVKVKAQKADYAAAVEDMTNVMIEKINNGELVYEDLTDDDYMDILKDCLKAEDAKMLESEFEVKCIRIGSKWYLNGEDESLENFINEGVTDVE